MPKWAKILMITLGTLFVLLGIAGYIGAKALQKGFEKFEDSMEQAKVDGEVFGLTATLEECVEQGVHRAGQCEEGIKAVVCIPRIGEFLWACLESATYDGDFCAGVPSAENEFALKTWGRNTCAKHGQPDNRFCPVAIGFTAAFCESKKADH